MTEWSRYYDAVSDDPRETLLDALDRFDAPGVAADLGCGTGRDTVELLRRGWQVVAIDSEEEAIRRLRATTATTSGCRRRWLDTRTRFCRKATS